MIELLKNSVVSVTFCLFILWMTGNLLLQLWICVSIIPSTSVYFNVYYFYYELFRAFMREFSNLILSVLTLIFLFCKQQVLWKIILMQMEIDLFTLLYMWKQMYTFSLRGKLKHTLKSCRMAWWIKPLANKPDYPSLISRTHIMEKREQYLQIVLWPPHEWHCYPHPNE